jgi:hypothetical protein
MSDRKCVNCRHNKRILRQTYIETRCEIDNHYIGYNECFTDWCRHWAKDHTFDKAEEGQVMNSTTFQGSGNVAYVPVIVNDKLKRTKADLVRSMTDEELAKFLTKKMYARIAGDWKSWLSWLREETEDGNN